MNVSQRIPLDGEIRDGRHFLAVRVYHEDTDFTGIVYHPNFLRYMERGRTNHLRLIAADHRALLEATEKEAPGFAFVVRSMTLDFLKPARMDDLLEIVTEPEVVKGASIILHQRVMRGDELLVEASVRVAFVSGGRALVQGPPVFIASDLAEGRLVTALDEWAPTPATGFFLYYPSRRQMRPALKAFLDFLRKERHGA